MAKHFLIITSLFIFFSCVSKNEKDFKQATTINTLDNNPVKEISFSRDVNPIFQSRCVECHSAGSTDPNRPGDYFFTDYNGIKAKVDEKHPGSDLSKIEFRIKSSDPNVKMPFLKAPLSDTEIQLIVSWISQGAKDN